VSWQGVPGLRVSAGLIGFEVEPVRAYYEGTQGGYFDAGTPVGERDLDNQADSWMATVAWRITGEPFDGRIFHERDVAPLGPNAWEVALRYANGDIDRDFFEFGLTDSGTSSQEFRSTTVALHWYQAGIVRLQYRF
jgi:hypothetical protein